MGNFISGIDEAGRGSVLGPLIIVGVSIEKDRIDYFKEMGVKDSKLFTGFSARKNRSKLAVEIQHQAKEIKIIEVPSIEIDQALSRRPKDNLNLLELRYFSQLIQELDAKEVYADTISSPYYSMIQILNLIQLNNASLSFKIIETSNSKTKFTLEKGGKLLKDITISSKAESKYMVVAAASCVAKHIRDLKLREIEQEWNLPELILGYGYPNEKDQNLMRFLDEYSNQIRQHSYPFIRYQWDWSCLQQIIDIPRKKLDQYF